MLRDRVSVCPALALAVQVLNRCVYQRLRRGRVPTEDHLLLLCLVVECAELAKEALRVLHVVNVQKALRPYNNVHIVGITTNTADITNIAMSLTDCGLDVEEEILLNEEHVRPFNHFEDDILEYY